MITPPPLPAAIQHQIFYGKAASGGIRLDLGTILIERINNAHQKAEAWLHSRPGIEIITISSGSASHGSGGDAFFVTVWYRERS